MPFSPFEFISACQGFLISLALHSCDSTFFDPFSIFWFSCNSHLTHHLLQPFIMSLRTHLDRYCLTRTPETITSMATPGPRSRSPSRNIDGALNRVFPFFAPPGWRPPAPRRIRPVIFQINIEPSQLHDHLRRLWHPSGRNYASSFVS